MTTAPAREAVEMLPLSTVAQRLRRSKATLRQELLSDDPPFPFERFGNRIRVSEVVLQDYLARTRTPDANGKAPKGPAEPIELATSGSQERPCPHCGGLVAVSLTAEVVIAPSDRSD